MAEAPRMTDLLGREIEQVYEVYPDLNFSDDSRGDLTVKGTFPVVHEDVVLDRYKMFMSVPREYPRCMPVLRETGNRIPRSMDRHINSDGTACLFVPDELAKWLPEGSTMLDLLRGPVHSFFLSQTYFERTRSWPFGERPHGYAGVLHAYAEVVESTDVGVGRRVMEVMAMKKANKRMLCPCGSGKRLLHCHLKEIASAAEVFSPDVAAASLGNMANIKHAPPNGGASLMSLLRQWRGRGRGAR